MYQDPFCFTHEAGRVDIVKLFTDKGGSEPAGGWATTDWQLGLEWSLLD